MPGFSELFHNIRLMVSPAYREMIKENDRTALTHLYHEAKTDFEMWQALRNKRVRQHAEVADVSAKMIAARNEMLRYEKLIKDRGFFDEVA